MKTTGLSTTSWTDAVAVKCYEFMGERPRTNVENNVTTADPGLYKIVIISQFIDSPNFTTIDRVNTHWIEDGHVFSSCLRVTWEYSEAHRTGNHEIKTSNGSMASVCSTAVRAAKTWRRLYRPQWRPYRKNATDGALESSGTFSLPARPYCWRTALLVFTAPLPQTRLSVTYRDIPSSPPHSTAATAVTDRILRRGRRLDAPDVTSTSGSC